MFAVAINNPDTIDIMSESPSGDVVLTVSDHLDWSNAADHQLALQTKLNTYLRFIESGEIYENHPNALGRNVVIHVVGKFEPNSEGWLFLQKAASAIVGAGFGFEYRNV
jgi:hypothetical protein